MKNPLEIAQDQKILADKRNKDEASHTDKTDNRLWVLRLASNTLNAVREHTYNVKLTNEKDYTRDLARIERAVLRIPKVEEVSVKNQKDYAKDIARIEKAILAIKFPEVKIPALPTIPDNKSELKSIEKAVKDIKFPEIKFPEQKETDFSGVVQAINELQELYKLSLSKSDTKTQDSVLAVLKKLETGLSNAVSTLQLIKDKKDPEVTDRTDEVLAGLLEVSQTIREIKFPVPNFPIKPIVDAIEAIPTTPATDVSTLAKETTLQKLVGFTLPEFDAYYIAYPTDTTWVLTYKKAGNTVATVTVTFVDNTQAKVSSVVRS
jgi:hypothetical protein